MHTRLFHKHFVTLFFTSSELVNLVRVIWDVLQVQALEPGKDIKKKTIVSENFITRAPNLCPPPPPTYPDIHQKSSYSALAFYIVDTGTDVLPQRNE